MPIWASAFFVLLLAVPGFAMADAQEQHDEVEAAMEEPRLDEEPPIDNRPQNHEDEAQQDVTYEQLHKLHAKMDADANGKLSMDEIVHFYRETRTLAAAKEAPGIVEAMDRNKDGKLSLDELSKEMMAMLDGEDEDGGHDGQKIAARKAHEAREGDKFKAADADFDGLLDEKELAVFLNPDVHDNILQIVAQRTMEEKDDDKDGFLTIEEFWGRVQGDPEAYRNDVLTFKIIDHDGSGKIDTKELLLWESGHIHTLQELENFMQLADTDRDQHVAVEELHAAHEKEENTAKFYFMEMAQHHEL